MVRGRCDCRGAAPAALILLTLVSCAPRPDGPSPAVLEAVEAVRAEVAPDPRLAIFDIRLRRERGVLVVEGEVDDADAREKALAAVRSLADGPVEDRVKVLPDPDLGEGRFGLVAVSVGNVRREPRHTAELVTQVLMGAEMEFLKKDRGWYFARGPDGYLGWLEGSVMDLRDEAGLAAWRRGARVMVVDPYGVVRESPESESQPVSDVVIGAKLKGSPSEEEWTPVELPDGRKGFLERRRLVDYEDWRRRRAPSAEEILRTARMFLGVPYLWGGNSAKAFDCSGFVQTVFGLNGLRLNRDASQQVLSGTEVDPGARFRNLIRGDLLFFGSGAEEGASERIVHVGIYLGDEEFIHSGNGRVRINSLDPDAPHYDEANHRRFVRAKRLLEVDR